MGQNSHLGQLEAFGGGLMVQRWVDIGQGMVHVPATRLDRLRDQGGVGESSEGRWLVDAEWFVDGLNGLKTEGARRDRLGAVIKLPSGGRSRSRARCRELATTLLQ